MKINLIEYFIDIFNVEKFNKKLGFIDFIEIYWKLYLFEDLKDVLKYCIVLDYDI